MNIDINALRTDYERFCKLHSWYKHIPLGGADFWGFQDVGQQPRNGVVSEVTDTEGIHWYFSMRQPADIPSYKVRFGPFLRGIEGYFDQTPITRGFNIIVSDTGETFAPWIQAHYPHLAHIDWSSPTVEWKAPLAIEELYVTETKRYWDSVLEAVAMAQK